MKELIIEVWSDVVCPFCYIGKRHLEEALQSLDESVAVQIEWKSFQLNPNTPTDSTESVYAYLAKSKGISLEESQSMHQRVVNMAAQAGLRFDFDKAVVCNTLHAHRLLHLAKKTGKQNALKEAFLHAYFTQGANLNNPSTLIDIASQTGLPKEECEATLLSNQMALEVELDIREAQNLGIRGVPFFVINRKLALSGAQPVAVFRSAFEQALQTD